MRAGYLLSSLLALSLTATAATSQKLPIRQPRLDFFIIDQKSGIGIASPGVLHRNGREVGRYDVLHRSGQTVLCRFHPAPGEVLSTDCYTIGQGRKSALASDGQTVSPQGTEGKTPVETKPAPIQPPASITIHSIRFVRSGPFLVPEQSFPFHRFGAIDALSEYLEGLQRSAPPGFRVTVPTQALVTANKAYFARLFGERIHFCLIEGRIGYCYFQNGEPVFNPLLKQTLTTLADKFNVCFLLIPPS